MLFCSTLVYSLRFYVIICYSIGFYYVRCYSIILKREAVSRFCSTLQRGAYFKPRGYHCSYVFFMEGCLFYISLFCSNLFYSTYILKGGCLFYSTIVYSLKGGRVTVLFYSIVPCEERACHYYIQLYKGLQYSKGGGVSLFLHCFFRGLPYSILAIVLLLHTEDADVGLHVLGRTRPTNHSATRQAKKEIGVRRGRTGQNWVAINSTNA